ncbi:MAG: hypothetical protein ACPGOY_06305 [Rhodospirillaceae bacterium]
MFAASPPPAALSLDRLAHHLKIGSERAAQRCAWDYCRTRAGRHWAGLMRDPAFAKAVARLRDVSHATMLRDLCLLVYRSLCAAKYAPTAALRAPVGQRPEMGADLETPFLAIAGTAGLPADEIAALRPRLPGQNSLPDLAKSSGRTIFEALPDHPVVSAHDRGLVITNVSFALSREIAEFEAEFDRTALVGSLLAYHDHQDARPLSVTQP